MKQLKISGTRFGWADPVPSRETGDEMRKTIEAGSKTNFGNGKRGVAQQQQGMLQTQLEQVLIRAARGKLFEDAAEMKVTDKCVAGDFGKG